MTIASVNPATGETIRIFPPFDDVTVERRLGLDLTVFDSKFDPLTQVHQVQNAMQQGKFDAFIVDPFDGNTMCPVLSRQAPAKGIVVVTSAVTMCNHVLVDEGDASWSPGTLAQAG